MQNGENVGFLAITENANDIKAAIEERKTFVIRTAIAVGIVIIIFSFVLNRYFLKPIKNLVSYTKTIKDKKSKTSGLKKRDVKLTVSRALSDEIETRERSLASVKRARQKELKNINKEDSKENQKPIKRNINIPEAITVRELANRMAEQSSNVIKHLFGMGVTVTINQTLAADTAEYLVKEFGHNPIREEKAEEIIKKIKDSRNENLKNRGNFDDYATKAIVELWHGSKDCKLVVDLMDKSLDLGKHRWNLYPASAVYSHCGEYDKALSSARLGLELLPNDPRWVITSSLVSTLFKMSKLKEVVEARDKNINAPDVGELILGVYTASQIELENMKKAKKMFSRIQKNGRLKKSIIKTRMFPKGDTADRLINSLEKIGPIPD